MLLTQKSEESSLSSQFSVLSSQFSVLSSQFSVLSSQFSVLSSQFSVLSSRIDFVLKFLHEIIAGQVMSEKIRAIPDLFLFKLVLRPVNYTLNFK